MSPILLAARPDTSSGEEWAHRPTGIVGTDQPMLAEFADDLPQGARGRLHHGIYALDDAWSISKHCAMQGVGVTQLYKPLGATGGGDFNTPSDPPYLDGTVLLQTGAAKDIIKLTGAGKQVDLKGLGLRFDDAIRFANTGHGVNAATPDVYLVGHNHGVLNAHWEDLVVWGHDGNHYAFTFLNPILLTLEHLFAHGGGGFKFEVDSDFGTGFGGNYGNVVASHLYSHLFVNGTAHCFYCKPRTNVSSQGGTLNLMTFVRPQGVVSNQFSRYGTTAPTAPTQALWKTDVGMQNVLVLNPDLESPLSGFTALYGPGPRMKVDRASGGLGSADVVALKPTAAAGTGAGTSPPAPVVTSGSDDHRGAIQMGTGSSPGASFGQLAVVTFNDPNLPTPRAVILSPQSGSAHALRCYAGSISATGFAVIAETALAAGKTADNSGYALNYLVVRDGYV